MQDLIFITIIALILSVVYSWAFKHLPRERWQILGVIPIDKQPDGRWHGRNLTYYGLINACAATFALAILFVLLAACGVTVKMMLITLIAAISLFAPFAKWTASWVEKKKHTLSIGGAAFCGIVGSPVLLLVLQRMQSFWGCPELPVMHFMAALAIGYAFGEGNGRLACLSFGCCYGKPIDQLPGFLRRPFSSFSVIFHGPTKKAAYADGLTGRKILAIQAMTAVLYSAAGLMGTYLFLRGYLKSAYLVCILATQIWRILSEFLRADYRGGGAISAYQYLAATAALSALCYGARLPAMPLQADLSKGLLILWNPAIILVCQILWLGIFLFTGRSKITAAHIGLYVRSDRI